MQSANRSYAYLSLLAAGIFGSQLASAQTAPACLTTNTLVVGTYGFVLNSGVFFSGVTTNPPGTTGSTSLFQPLAVNPPGTTTAYSNTQIGRLLGGLAGTAVGAVSGVFYFDGNGNIFASATVGGSPTTQVGTYTVNNDCTITVSFNDAFSTSTPHPSAVPFTGLLVGDGTEIDLLPDSQLTPPAGTTGATSALLRLVRIQAQQNCSASTLTGTYGLVGTGFTDANISTAFLARVLFDGTGKVLDGTISGVTTPLSLLQYTGTYTVFPDCTGALTLKPPAAATPSTTASGTGAVGAPAISAYFVITSPIVQVNSNGNVAFQSPFGLRPSLLFSLASRSQVISGIGTAQ
jgi:hypothetical protein